MPPPRPFLGKSKIEVTNLSIDDGHIEIRSFVASICHNKSGNIIRRRNRSGVNLKKFNISESGNKFTVIGCDSYAYLQGWRDTKFHSAGCMSTCSSSEFVDYSSCSGSGCCQIDIPVGLYNITVRASSFNNTIVVNYSPCTHAFVVEDSKFNFSSKHLTGYDLVGKRLPLLLDWAINNSNIINACKDNAEKIRPNKNPQEYRCRCREGYQGNPYLGCHDINECDYDNNCRYPSICENNNGSYTCRCPDGYRWDGRKDGEVCKSDDKSLFIIKIILGIGISFISLFVGSSWLYLVLKQRKLIRLKAEFFKKNGGLIVKQKLSKQEGASDTAKIFTAEELKKATNNYDENTIVGKGGFGIVYKGILENNKEVAIKKSIQVDQSQIEQFVNEVVVLPQINHRNVVRLLGCCLETEVPLLVYEFIPSGALSKHIHDENKASALSWDVRLRVAVETAGALSYLHSEASVPIIHQDVKTDNILLDANYTAKVSDFGASRLVPLNEMQLCTIVQGTCGYLDPEYMQTSQLTEKSDVYSFGVVLVELLTGKKVLCFERPEEMRNLALYFLSSMKVGNLFEILDNRIVNEENKAKLEPMA